MKEITQAFMNVLYGMKMQSHNVKAIVQLFWGQKKKMDQLVKFIKANLAATESEIIQKALQISKMKE